VVHIIKWDGRVLCLSCIQKNAEISCGRKYTWNVYYPGDLPVISVCRKFNISSSVIYGVAELATTQVMVLTQVSFKINVPPWCACVWTGGIPIRNHAPLSWIVKLCINLATFNFVLAKDLKGVGPFGPHMGIVYGIVEKLSNWSGRQFI